MYPDVPFQLGGLQEAFVAGTAGMKANGRPFEFSHSITSAFSSVFGFCELFHLK